MKVLFISHEASRTGAPIRFLNLLTWIKKNTDIQFLIILRNGGELEREYAKLAPTILLETPRERGLLMRIKGRLGFHESTMKALYELKKENIGLIYSNTITNGSVLQQLAFLQCPVISAANELEFVTQLAAKETFNMTKQLSERFVACSEAVKKNLILRHNIMPDSVDVIPGFIPITVDHEHGGELVRSSVLKELGIPADAFIVGASASLTWHKGPDLFIYLASIISSQRPDAPIYFLWLGGDPQGDDIEHVRLRFEMEKLDLHKKVHFIGSKPNPLDYYRTFDVFTMVSREDPFPLVCLEAASLGKPILCFDNAGGMPEFIEDDCGYVVPYLDLHAMAGRIIELYSSEKLRNSLGDNSARKVRERHDIEKCAPKVAALINKYLSNQKSRE